MAWVYDVQSFLLHLSLSQKTARTGHIREATCSIVLGKAKFRVSYLA